MHKLVLLTLFIVYGIQGQTQFTVSINKRFLVKNGKPFFWLGDTAWELFHRLNREEAVQYLKILNVADSMTVNFFVSPL